MRRFAEIFIAICIPIVAASAGAIAYYQFEATGRMAVAFSFTILVILVLVRLDGLRRHARREADERVTLLTRRLGEFSGDIDALDRRLGALEDGGSRRHREDMEQLVAEVEMIGTLTRQLIETVADLEVQVADGRSAMLRGGDVAAPALAGTVRAEGPVKGSSAFVPDRFSHLDDDSFLTLVRNAIDSDRIDMNLQPIVTLPQRKVRFYEALTRLRTDDGETIHPSDYIPIAEARGYMAVIDEQILTKSVHILRRLAERSKEVGIFLNLSAASLAHAGFFRDFVQVLEKNRDLAQMLVLEFPQSAVRAMGPIENEGLKALYDLGYRFSVDQVSDLKISFQNLADRGFRYVKISADRLLNRSNELGTDIHPVDLTDYFRRFGMELIADHVEREAEVVDVLDYGVRLGQGFLFSPPRPVKVDAVQSPDGRGANRAAPKPAPEARAVATRPAETTGAIPRGGPAPVPSPRPAAKPTARAAPQPAQEEAPRPGIRIVPGTTR
jgi:cyclic-di-GMP phosphodiesterase, flagellum assembly factor TipF